MKALDFFQVTDLEDGGDFPISNQSATMDVVGKLSALSADAEADARPLVNNSEGQGIVSAAAAYE